MSMRRLALLTQLYWRAYRDIYLLTFAWVLAVQFVLGASLHA